MTVLGASVGSTVVGDETRAGDDCFDPCCCLDFSSPSFKGGVSLFLRAGSSFGGAVVGLGPDSELGPFAGLRPSFFSGTLIFFLSFFPLTCF